MKRLVVCLLSVCLMSPLVNAQKTADKKETSKQNTTSTTKKTSTKSSQKQGASKSTKTSDKDAEKAAVGKKTADPKKPWISIADPPLKKRVAQITKKLKVTEKRKLLKFLNEAKSTELIKIQGVGKSRAQNLTKGRPYKAVDDIIDITGIGEKTFGKVIAHLKKL